MSEPGYIKDKDTALLALQVQRLDQAVTNLLNRTQQLEQEMRALRFHIERLERT